MQTQNNSMSDLLKEIFQSEPARAAKADTIQDEVEKLGILLTMINNSASVTAIAESVAMRKRLVTGQHDDATIEEAYDVLAKYLPNAMFKGINEVMRSKDDKIVWMLLCKHAESSDDGACCGDCMLTEEGHMSAALSSYASVYSFLHQFGFMSTLITSIFLMKIGAEMQRRKPWFADAIFRRDHGSYEGAERSLANMNNIVYNALIDQFVDLMPSSYEDVGRMYEEGAEG